MQIDSLHIFPGVEEMSMTEVLGRGEQAGGRGMTNGSLICSPRRILSYSLSPGATTPIGDCILQPSSELWPSRLRGFLITHNDAPHSVGFIGTNDQSVAETST